VIGRNVSQEKPLSKKLKKNVRGHGLVACWAAIVLGLGLLVFGFHRAISFSMFSVVET